MQKTIEQNIQEFLAVERFAMIGVSTKDKHFSRSLYREFLKNGYDVVPVNPHADKIEGATAFQNISDIQPPVKQALIITPEDQTMHAVKESQTAGLERIWLYGISGEKDIHPDILFYCLQTDIEVIPGFCPFMVLPQAAFPHKIHGAVWKFLGKFPSI